MIAKQIKGTGFSGVIAYNEKKVNNGEAELLETNLSGRTNRELTREINLVKQLRPNLTRAVYHVSLNLPKHENLSNENFTSIALKYLSKMGFDDNQYLIYRHYDSDNSHCHCIVNRVKYSGEVVSESNDYKRSEKIVRQLEVEYGLERLEAVAKRSKSKLTKAEIEKTLRTGEIPIRVIMQQKIDSAILNSKTINEFILRLQNENIHLKFNISKTTNRVSGLSFKMDGVIYKASKLGKNYSWNKIKLNINYEQNRDSTIIRKVNAGTARFTISEQESIFRASVDEQKPYGKTIGTQGASEYNRQQSILNGREISLGVDHDEETAEKKRKSKRRSYFSY